MGIIAHENRAILSLLKQGRKKVGGDQTDRLGVDARLMRAEWEGNRN